MFLDNFHVSNVSRDYNSPSIDVNSIMNLCRYIHTNKQKSIFDHLQRTILIIIDWSTYFFTFSDISLQCQIKLLNFCINTQHYICTDISILLIQALILPHHLCAHLLTDSSYHTYFEGSFDKTDLRKLSVRYDAIPNMYFFLDNAKNNYWYVFVYVFTCIWY